MEKSTKIILYSTIGLAIVGGGIGIVYFVRNYSKKKQQIGAIKRNLESIIQGDKVSDDKLRELISAANKAGSDMFEGLSFDKVKEYYQNGNNLDADILIRLIRKRESNWTSYDKAEFEKAWTHMTGKSLPKS